MAVLLRSFSGTSAVLLQSFCQNSAVDFCSKAQGAPGCRVFAHPQRQLYLGRILGAFSLAGISVAPKTTQKQQTNSAAARSFLGEYFLFLKLFTETSHFPGECSIFVAKNDETTFLWRESKF